MKNREAFAAEIENNEIFIITMDVIEECLDDAIEKVENLEYNPC